MQFRYSEGHINLDGLYVIIYYTSYILGSKYNTTTSSFRIVILDNETLFYEEEFEARTFNFYVRTMVKFKAPLRNNGETKGFS